MRWCGATASARSSRSVFLVATHSTHTCTREASELVATNAREARRNYSTPSSHRACQYQQHALRPTILSSSSKHVGTWRASTGLPLLSLAGLTVPLESPRNLIAMMTTTYEEQPGVLSPISPAKKRSASAPTCTLEQRAGRTSPSAGRAVGGAAAACFGKNGKEGRDWDSVLSRVHSVGQCAECEIASSKSRAPLRGALGAQEAGGGLLVARATGRPGRGPHPRRRRAQGGGALSKGGG